MAYWLCSRTTNLFWGLNLALLFTISGVARRDIMKEINFSDRVIEENIKELKEDELTDSEVINLLIALGVPSKRIAEVMEQDANK